MSNVLYNNNNSNEDQVSINKGGLNKLGMKMILVLVEYVAHCFHSGIVCGLPDLFNDQKSLKKQQKLLTLILTHLLFWQ